MCIAHVLIAAIRNNIEQICCNLLVRGFMGNYKIWNKHGEDGENLHHEASWHDTVLEIMHENIVERVHERVEQTVNEVDNDTMADDEVSDDLDQMIRDGKPKFQDARNLKKLK